MKKQTAVLNALIGHRAPDFTLALLNAQASSASLTTLHLNSVEGKPIVLNFWASWCDPCKHEAPLLRATWPILQRQGGLLLGIDFQDTQPNALVFLHTYGITYPNVIDSTGTTAMNYKLVGLPETFFLNRQGVIVAKVTGELTEQTLQSNLQLLTS